MRELYVLGLAGLISLMQQSGRAEVQVPRWDVFEASFRSSIQYANPYTDAELSCVFTGPAGRKLMVEGFWDGEGVWKVRFSPGAVGRWNYETLSNDKEMHGQKGAFRCVASENHGFVGIDPSHPHHFAYSDGTPFYFLGDSDSCWDTPVDDEKRVNYKFIFLAGAIFICVGIGVVLGRSVATHRPRMFKMAIRFMAALFLLLASMIFVRGIIGRWPFRAPAKKELYWGGWFWRDGSYQRYIDARAKQGFTVQAFFGGTLIAKPTFRRRQQRNEGGPPFFDYDLDRLNPAYFQWADKRTQYACSKGFLSVIMLGWPDRGVHKMDWKKLERGWRYVIARYAAYNVMWLLFGEYEEARMIARKLVNHFAKITRKYDPYHHLLSTHTLTSNASLAEEKWLDVIVHQSRDWDMVQRDRRFGRPIVNWEWYYETPKKSDVKWVHIISDADEIRRGAWRILCRGGYIVYNLLGKNREDYINNINRDGARFCLIATSFFRNQTRFQELEPATATDEDGKSLPALATKDGREWVVYLERANEALLPVEKLPPELKAEWLDPRTGKTRPAKSVAPSRWRKPDARDWVLSLKPY